MAESTASDREAFYIAQYEPLTDKMIAKHIERWGEDADLSVGLDRMHLICGDDRFIVIPQWRVGEPFLDAVVISELHGERFFDYVEADTPEQVENTILELEDEWHEAEDAVRTVA